MKIKFLAAFVGIFFAASSLALAADDAAATKSAKSKTKESELYNSTQNITDIKTFDFDRIFKEADAYFNAAQKWKVLKCIPKSLFVCSKRECPKLKLNGASALIVDKSKETLALCRDKVCQYYTAEFEQTGVFINVKVKNINGINIRILGDSRFKEIALVGLDAYITNGECEVLDD